MVESESEPPTGGKSLTGTLVADRYRIDELIGEGGMGAVYRATHVHMQKPVAVKVLHREMTLNEEARKRFEREAIASGRIQHPHVTGATDFGKLEDGSCYLVLDYVSGQSLKTLLAVEGKLRPDRAVAITRQIALALEAAHAAGVIHRDLKPDNVMLIEHQGETDFVKVLDFGIAKLESRNTGATVQLTQIGAVFGTPQYMSPEQAAGNAVDGRSDLYTIGIMLFEMLSGDTPFQGESIIAILTAHLTADPPPLPKDLPPALQGIVKKLLAKDPERRFQTATDLIDALDRLGQTSEAHTIPAPALATERNFGSEVRRVLAEAKRKASVLGAEYRSAPVVVKLESALAVARAHPLAGKLRRLAITPVHVAGRTFPVWMAAAASFAVGLCLVFLLWSFSSHEPDAQGVLPSDDVADTDKPSDPKKPKIDLQAAANGDAPALDALAKLKETERTPAQSRARMVGEFARGNSALSLTQLRAALGRHPELGKDEAALQLALALAHDDEHAEVALALLAEKFGSLGPDALYALTQNPPKNVDEAFKKRFQKALEDSKKNQSEALKLVLGFDAAKSCTAYKELLPKAKELGDDRLSASLRKLTVRRGCGLLGIGDCYKCLRRDNTLSDAVEAVKGRKAPVIPESLKPASSKAAPTGSAP